MKQIEVKGEIKTQWGTTLPETLNYAGRVDQFTEYGELVEANEVPTAQEVMDFVNTQKVNNKRQKLMADRLTKAAEQWVRDNGEPTDENPNPYVKPTIKTSADLRLKNIVDSLMAGGKSLEDATRIAKRALEIE